MHFLQEAVTCARPYKVGHIFHVSVSADWPLETETYLEIDACVQ